ncbi:MAG: MBOAT family O-acyltransferase [Acidobacteriota bacterium]
MIFTEFRFFLFAAVVWCVFWAMSWERGRKLWLLVASYFFYAAWDPRFLVLIWISTGVDYAVGRALAVTTNPRHRRLWLLLSLTSNLGLLGVFKYYDFFIESAVVFLDFLGLGSSLSTLSIILPVGISFYTFQTLSYTVDVYRCRLEAERSLLNLALFVGFFPQLVAGPIVRASEFLPQLKIPRRLEDSHFRWGAGLFAVGFIKKAVVSDNLAPIVDTFFAHPQEYPLSSAWLVSMLYGVQIYCDFSGYSDMAIGTAAFLGYRLPDNFYYPLLGSSPRAFWQRWHISLSTWLRDYLYIPLGGSRGSSARTYINLMITMVLAGLWHGAGWIYVLWGGIHGVALTLHRAWRLNLPGLRRRTPRWLSFLLFQVFLGWTWFFFRAHSLEEGIWMCLHVFNPLVWGSERVVNPLWWLAFLLLAAIHFGSSRPHLRHAVIGWHERAPAWQLGMVWGAGAGLLLPLIPVDPQPFIYFQF